MLVDGLDHPEGVAYDPAADVIWAGGEAGQLYRVAGGALRGGRAGAGVRAGAGGRRGRPARGLRLQRRLAVRATTARTCTAWSPDLGFPNWPAFAPDGTLYVSDSGGWGADDGRLVRIDVDGTVETFSREVPHFTNGCAVTPDGRWLWVVESYVPIVSRFDLETGGARRSTACSGRCSTASPSPPTAAC